MSATCILQPLALPILSSLSLWCTCCMSMVHIMLYWWIGSPKHVLQTEPLGLVYNSACLTFVQSVTRPQLPADTVRCLRGSQVLLPDLSGPDLEKRPKPSTFVPC